MSNSTATAHAIPPNCELIEVRVRALDQLFNLIDPSPFHERDLDPDADEFIENWAQEAHRSAPLALLVYLDAPPPPGRDETAILREAVRQFFSRKATTTRRRLRDLFRRGRISLLIALAFFAVMGATANLLAGMLEGAVGGIVREGLLIGGWVAMWRPLEVFLYDWWPIRAQARLYDRLAAMPVRLQHTATVA